MSRYSYQCTNCGHIFYKVVPFDNRAATEICPECGLGCVRLPPKPLEAEVFELADGFKNKHVKKDINKIMKDRSKKYRER